MRFSNISGYVVVFTITLLTTGPGLLALEIPPMPPLKTFYTEVAIAHAAEPDCLIAVPPGDDYAQIGQKIAAAIKRVSGADIPVKNATTISRDRLRDTNLILVGYFANNPLVNRIYDEHYVCLDTSWPGPGGYVIRTVHDPMGTGTCFVYLGGADIDAVTKATDDFITSLPEEGDIVYPHTVQIVLPDGPMTHEHNPERIASAINDLTGKNFGAVAARLTQAGTSYYLSGDPDEVAIFKGTAAVLHDIIKKTEKISETTAAMGLLNMWDVVEEAPGFSNTDRAAITAMMWEFANKSTYANTTTQDSPIPSANNCNSQVAWDIARYFMKYYDLDVAGLWTWCDVYFKSKAKFWRSAEDCPGYGGLTVYDTLYWALPAQYDEYFDSGLARKMADYGLAVMNNLGGYAGFGDTSKMGVIGHWGNIFAACAWKYRDGRYIYALDRCPGLVRSYFSCNNYSQDLIEPELPEDMLGIHVVPLPDWVYDHRESVLGTAPKAMNPVLDADPMPPREECFDKISFRTSFERQDQYLLLGGISHGFHAHPDGNSIIEFTDNDRYCLFDSGYFVPDTIEHNTLVIYRDGLFEPIPRLTGLAALGDFPRVGMTRTYLNGYNGVNWRRNIVWNKEKYFLVIDEVEAVEAGEYGLNAIFRTLSDDAPKIDQDRVTAIHKGKPFGIVSASHTPFKSTSTQPRVANRHAIVESKSVQMQRGDRQYFMNLLYATDEERAWPYEIVSAGDGVVMVKSPEGYAFAGTGKAQPLQQTVFDAAVFYIEPDSFALADGKRLTAGGRTWFAASKPVNIQIDILRTATGTIEAKEETQVVLLAAGEVKLDGELVQLRDGKRGPDTVMFTVPPGDHRLSYFAVAGGLDIGSWQDAYERFEERHREVLAALASGADESKQMQAAWEVENAQTVTSTVYLNQAGETMSQITRSGKAKCWTEAQNGARADRAVDGNPETYAAVGSRIEWANDLPKDIGVEWDKPVDVGCVQIDYYNASYAPTMPGQQLQAWDGEDWYPIEAEIDMDESGARWTYRFTPVKTTRIRVFITEFNGARTAVREMRLFSEPVTVAQRDTRAPFL